MDVLVSHKQRVEDKHHPCARCGFLKGSHWSLNFADGPHISGEVLVCPTATYKADWPDAKPEPEKPRP